MQPTTALIMAQRSVIPKSIREQVLSEYNHRCAICGEDHPHLHHIDNDPSNNVTLNLIPLCPNCHLTGQHNPHRALDSRKLQFFRIHKHPAILAPQFHPLFLRLKFLEEARTAGVNSLIGASAELVRLIAMHEKGQFYAELIGSLLHYQSNVFITVIGDPESERRSAQQREEDSANYRSQLVNARERVHELVVELLAYQNWATRA
jgi:hypothetical protein